MIYCCFKIGGLCTSD